MKRYILFFISIGLIIVAFFTYSIINVEKSKQFTFSEAGYVLKNTSERYYFLEEEKYTTSYDNQIVFNDTEGTKVTVNSDNFLHYTSGNLEALQDGVLLDLSQINNDPIIYYNISANKEVKKISDRYTVKNLNEDLSFEQAIWKISSTKYIILSNNINIELNNGTTKKISGYIEIEYSDNEIVSIYNQEVSYQTISSNSFIELDNDIKINLGTKIVSENDENKMSLEDMVINSDDNVTLIDLTENKDEKDKENTNEENIENEEQNTGTLGGSTSTIVNNNGSSTTIITDNSGSSTGIITDNNESNNNNNDNSSDNNSDSDNDNDVDNDSETDANTPVIDIQTAEIIYEYINDSETKVDETLSQTEPVFKLENMDIKSVGISGNIVITDDEDLLSKDDDIIIKIINNTTSKIVYLDEQSYGMYDIPLDVETLLPNTSYTLTVTATYNLDNNTYSKNFLYKTFVTSEVGIELSKDSYTNKSANFNLKFKDSAIESAEVTLLDSDGNTIANRNQIIKNTNLNENEEVNFEELSSNTKYTVKVSNIIYNGIIQEGTNWTIYYEFETLKNKASINELNFSIDKRNAEFTLYIEDVTDTDDSIINYTYYVYEFVETTTEDGDVITTYDEDNIVYQRQTTNKEIKVPVADASSDENIVRKKYYGFKVIATTYDNEKYVEIESNICGAMGLNGVTFPTVKFEKIEVTPTRIYGNMYILDTGNALVVDDNNPLTITYYSNVTEVTNVGEKITDLSMYNRINDENGDELIVIPIDIGNDGNQKDGLKSETSYTFSVYATIDLGDGNGELKNAYIGSSIVTTAKYSEIIAELTTGDLAENTFTVYLQLDGDEIEEESLTSVSLLLYEGSGDINKGEYKNWKRTITTQNYSEAENNAVNKDEEITSLQDLLFDNTLMITPSFIGGGSESSYTEVNYQVLVTVTVDGTEYENKIPIKAAEDDNDNTDTTIYKKGSESYTAAYIIVDGKGTTSDVNKDMSTIEAKAITNKDATSYGIAKNSNLNDSTCVGYYISTVFTNNGSLNAEKITYYVWDSNGNAVYDENGKQIIKTLRFTTQDSAPSAVFELNYGTTDDLTKDNNSGMHRGNAYYFSYTVTYKDTNGNEKVWPMTNNDENNQYTEKSIKTSTVYPDKQDPSFVFYPIKSTEDTITYKYSCKDVDKALYYSDSNSQDVVYLTLLSSDGLIQDNAVEIKTSGNMDEVTFSELKAGKTYTLSYNKKLNKVKNTSYSSVELFSQKFEGIVNCDSVKISSVAYDDTKPNNIQIKLTGDNIERIAAAQVTLTNNDESITTKLLKISTDDSYYIDVDLMELNQNSNFQKFINTEVGIGVKIFFDNGKIGFAQDDGTTYATYTNKNNSYLKLGENGLEEDSTDSSTNGKIYTYRLQEGTSNASIVLRNIDNINNGTGGKEWELSYSDAGLVQNGSVVIQKEITTRDIDNDYTIKIKNLRIGITIDSIETTIITAEIKATLQNPTNIEINKITLELYHTPDKTKEPNWNDCTTMELDVVNNSIEISLDNLEPAEYYYARFKYKENDVFLYTYDVETKVIGRAYEFETLANIGISSVTIEYIAESYTNKYLDINYKVNELRSNMYKEIKYEFFEEDGVTKVNLKEENIIKNNSKANYQIKDGALIITNYAYRTEETFDSVNEKIYLNPEVNIFTMGKKYILKLTPTVTLNETRIYEIEKLTTEFKLEDASMPSIGLKMTRNETSIGDDIVKNIRVTIVIKDKDKVIYGSNYGEYQINVYRYYNDNIENKVKVNIYDKYTDGNNVTDKVFNLNDNGTNYSVYVQESNIDYTYNYIAELTFKTDKQNKGLSAATDSKEQYILKAIENETGIATGSVVVVKNGEDTEMRFYDSYYNITKIDRIDYFVYNVEDNSNISGSFEPMWILVNDEDSLITYYKIILPIEFSKNSIYTIKANLYASGTLAGQVDITYINK
jgi:hypothetical protein